MLPPRGESLFCYFAAHEKSQAGAEAGGVWQKSQSQKSGPSQQESSKSTSFLRKSTNIFSLQRASLRFS